MRKRKLVTFLIAALVVAAPLMAQECLTKLQGCELCVLANGTVDIRNCGQPPNTGDRLPPSQPPDTTHLDGLARVVADAVVEHWDAAIAPVLLPADGNRIYGPRALWLITGEYDTLTATGGEWRQAGVTTFMTDVVSRADNTYVAAVPRGNGDTVYTVRSPDVLLSFILRLLRGVDAFDGVDLAQYHVQGVSVLKVLKRILDAAACLRELPPYERADALLAADFPDTE